MTDSLLERLPRAVRALDDPPSPRRGSDDTDSSHSDVVDLLPPECDRAPAAVLVPIVNRDGTLSVLLTRRTDHLAQHAGQVSFPGGRSEADDADAVATALRETREEVGIDSALVMPFGYLDALETVSGFCVTPVVAWLDAAYHARPDPREVAEVFEVPLEFFLVPGNLRRLRVEYRGRPREVLEFARSGPRIWGATATMLMNLVRRLEATS
jgi:8-oxo-dGTP pyrophosphatase MutT (NUDIX family)